MAELKIETYTDSNSETRFRVVAENGQITLTPHEGYTREADCHRALEQNLSALFEAICSTSEGVLVVGEHGTRHRLRRILPDDQGSAPLGPIALQIEEEK